MASLDDRKHRESIDRVTKHYLSAHQKVVKSNEIVMQATYNLTTEEQKLLCYVISKIKPTDKEFERYTISARDFADLCGIDYKHIYRDFKQMIDDFDLKGQWIKIDDTNIKMRVFSEAEYNEKQGSITVMINSRLKKYLLDLHSNYTQYELWNILSLKSKYSIRLFELFRAYEFQHRIEFDIDRFRSLLCCENYALFGNLKARVIDRAVKEINDYTDITVKYSTIREESKGHKVTGIIFSIVKKPKKEALTLYWKTLDRINKRENQVRGQMSIYSTDDELDNVYNATEVQPQIIDEQPQEISIDSNRLLKLTTDIKDNEQ